MFCNAAYNLIPHFNHVIFTILLSCYISLGSGVTLGGVEYPVGSRVGKTGTFMIGDPGMFDPQKGGMNSAR